MDLIICIIEEFKKISQKVGGKLIEKVNNIFQTTGESVSGLVDSKSGLNLKKPFQKAGKIPIEKVKKIFQTTGEVTQEYQLIPVIRT